MTKFEYAEKKADASTLRAFLEAAVKRYMAARAKASATAEELAKMKAKLEMLEQEYYSMSPAYA